MTAPQFEDALTTHNLIAGYWKKYAPKWTMPMITHAVDNELTYAVPAHVLNELLQDALRNYNPMTKDSSL